MNQSFVSFKSSYLLFKTWMHFVLFCFEELANLGIQTFPRDAYDTGTSNEYVRLRASILD